MLLSHFKGSNARGSWRSLAANAKSDRLVVRSKQAEHHGVENKESAFGQAAMARGISKYMIHSGFQGYTHLQGVDMRLAAAHHVVRRLYNTP